MSSRGLRHPTSPGQFDAATFHTNEHAQRRYPVQSVRNISFAIPFILYKTHTQDEEIIIPMPKNKQFEQ